MRICRDTAILDIALLVNAEYQRVQQHSAASIGGWDRPGFEFETCLAHSVCVLANGVGLCVQCVFLCFFRIFSLSTLLRQRVCRACRISTMTWHCSTFSALLVLHTVTIHNSLRVLIVSLCRSIVSPELLPDISIGFNNLVVLDVDGQKKQYVKNAHSSEVTSAGRLPSFIVVESMVQGI